MQKDKDLPHQKPYGQHQGHDAYKLYNFHASFI
jgi:hypothetical protein